MKKRKNFSLATANFPLPTCHLPFEIVSAPQGAKRDTSSVAVRRHLPLTFQTLPLSLQIAEGKASRGNSSGALSFFSVSFLVRRQPDTSLAPKARLHQCEARLHQRRRRVFTASAARREAPAHYPLLTSLSSFRRRQPPPRRRRRRRRLPSSPRIRR